MPLKLVRNNIIDMNTEAIVNPTNTKPEIVDGCDYCNWKLLLS